jgi:addiction module HigA family antidote
MHRPPHPGEVLRDGWLAPLELSVTDAAKALGITRKTLSAIVNGRAGVSAEMAIRLSQAFDTTAESWMTLQLHHDLWHAQRRRLQLPRLRALRAHLRVPGVQRTATAKAKRGRTR